MHEAPWRLGVAEYQPTMLEAVLKAMGKLAITDTGRRNDTWILAHLQKFERHGKENGGQESIAARARLLQLWEDAQALIDRQQPTVQTYEVMPIVPIPQRPPIRSKLTTV